MGGDAVVRVEGVSHSYGHRSLRAQVLFDVSFQVRAGEVVILSGPSGSGKTTLLTLVGGLRRTQEGRVQVLGREFAGAPPRRLAEVRRSIGFVFQLHNLLESLSALQNVRMGMPGSRDLPRRAAIERARSTLEAVGLGDCAERFPDELSVGQRQRVAVARALAGGPRLVLADEPTASLDRRSGRDVVDALRSLARIRGCAVLLVTHDERVFDVADRRLRLEEGRLVERGEARDGDRRRPWAGTARKEEGVR